MSTDRLDRIESSLAISQLPSRYAMALDARDLDALVGLFVDDVEVGEQGRGREALKPHRMPTWRVFWEQGDPALPERLSRRP